LFKDLDDKRLRLIPLRRERPIILLPKGHRLTANREIYLKDLRNEEFVFHRREVASKYFDELVRICENIGGFTPRICHEVQSSSRQMAYVSCGQGIAMLGESFKDWIPKNIVARPIVDAPAEIQLSLVWNPLIQSALRDQVLEKLR
ncbi:LysR family substrate-binding domain-containing protein, partial [Turicimonas muris]